VKTFEKRLRLVETKTAPKQSRHSAQSHFTRLTIALLAHHLGGPKPRERFAEAYFRALGCASSDDYYVAHHRAQRGQELQVTDRHHDAIKRLCALRGYDPEDESAVARCLELLAVEAPPELLEQFDVNLGVLFADA
jgi:hypothetical protein